MKKYILIAFPFFVLCNTAAQTQRKISTYLSAQFNKTIYDRTLGNSPWSVGAGLRAFLNNKTKFKPIIELTVDVSVADDDVLRLSPDGKAVEDADGIINLFGGASFQPAKQFYLSFTLGPSFINSNTYFGIKPSIGFYLSKSQKLTARISYINIFNRALNYEENKKDDFGSISFSMAIKLF